jgi:O6-methylguanine-DNA--protein-cysteine methyltransferase
MRFTANQGSNQLKCIAEINDYAIKKKIFSRMQSGPVRLVRILPVFITGIEKERIDGSQNRQPRRQGSGPLAVIEDRDDDFKDWVRQVLAHLEKPYQRLKLPLDIQGTAFQRRLWHVLRDIPAGSTASYAEIAQKIGRPGAARAVARACASKKSPSPSPATGWSGKTARWAVTAGGLKKSGLYWTAKPVRL